jgi:hypothetical protein
MSADSFELSFLIAHFNTNPPSFLAEPTKSGEPISLAQKLKDSNAPWPRKEREEVEGG